MSKINGLPYDHLILACSWSGECLTVERVVMNVILTRIHAIAVPKTDAPPK